MYATNIFGPLALTQAFAALPRAENDGPRTVIYTSTAGITSIVPGTSAYGSSKNAGTYLARALAEENKDRNIRAFAFVSG